MTFDRDPQAGAPGPAPVIPDPSAGAPEPDPFAAWPGPPPPADPAPAPTPEPVSPRRRRLRRIGAAAGWLALASLIAFGGAGVVAVTNKPFVPGARPELTWTVDRALEPELRAAVADLATVSDNVDGLGDIGRRALTTLVDRNTTGLQKAIKDGETQLGLIAEATDRLRARLAAIPGIGPDDPTRIGAALRVRYDRLVAALSATDGLADSWSNLTRGSLAAIDLTTSLADHETQAAEAFKLGQRSLYKRALVVLDKADAALARSRLLRDRLAATTDVSILTRWIDRNAAYDAAVRRLYSLMVKSKGKVNKDIRAAFAEVSAAQAALPPDNRAMVVIMADVARGGLNQAVIEIEEARGRLAAAIDALRGG
jgi:hypothetical protein